MSLVALLTLCTLLAPPADLPVTVGNLEGEWRFSTDSEEVGEEAGWQDLTFDDSDWQTLRVPGLWEPQGITDPRPGKPPQTSDTMRYTDYDGVAWYRLRFIAPATWADQPLTLRLGSVDDQDRTFLNGQLVGATGPDVERSVAVWREYEVPAGVLRAGEENALAIRVFDGGGPGGIPGPLLTLLPTAEIDRMATLPTPDRPFDQRFDDPPANCRILKIVHGLPLQEKSQTALLSQLLAQGFGGIVTNVSFGDYLVNEDHWASLKQGVETAQQAGMTLWVYDEKGYPSGAAGGIVLKDHPEWAAAGLLIASASTAGEPVTLEVPPGKLVSALALPEADGQIDLDGQADLRAQIKDGKLSYDPHGKSQRVMVITTDAIYEGTHAALSLAEKLPYINLLDPAPTKAFLQVTHQRYAEHFGGNLGQTFAATFTDEPSLMSLWLRPMPYLVLPWSDNLAGAFEARRGYPLNTILPLLCADGPGSEKARYDYWRTVGELVSDSFFGQIRDWCREHQIPSGGHLLMEESQSMDVPLYGDFYRCTRQLDAPSIDCLTSLPPQVPWHIARLISTVADLQGSELTMCETSDHSQRYRRKGDERPVYVVSEDEIRGTCGKLILNGINTITSYYSFAGLSTTQMQSLNHWIGRCTTALRGGHQVTDLAVVYPVESMWPKFTPGKVRADGAPRCQRIEAVYDGVLNGLYQSGRDLSILDSQAIAESTVADGALVHGELRWRVVVLPAVDTLPEAVWDKLGAFVESGGVVIAAGARPVNSATEFPSPAAQALSQRLFPPGEEPSVAVRPSGGGVVYLPPGAEGLTSSIVQGVIEPDVATPAGSPLRVTHRRIDDRDIWFVLNDGPTEVKATGKLAAVGIGERCDPATGKIEAATGGEQPVTLPGYGGVLFRFAQARVPERLPLTAGKLPGFVLTDLPLVQPEAGDGEFVETEVTPDAAFGTADQPAWRVASRLTKTDVDTFCFLTFRYPDGLDLTGTTSLLVDFTVPAGQRTPTQMLVILEEADGAQWLGSTGCSLGVSGRQRAFLPLTALHPAGWSKHPDGVLTLAGIKRLSLGWGGYFGKDGERVEFSLRLPGAARQP